LLAHIRDEKYVERFDTFMLEKFDIHCEDYYIRFREYYEHYREKYWYYHGYYAFHLHDYYVTSIYNPCMYAQAFSDHYLGIVEPYARPYITNPTVNLALIFLAVMSRMGDLLPLPRENEPLDLSISDLNIFAYESDQNLNWFERLVFTFKTTCDVYGCYSKYQQ
jgi:hypothetical protein